MSVVPKPGRGCPSCYRDTDTSDILGQDIALTDPKTRSQPLPLKPGEAAVVVPAVLAYRSGAVAGA
ncbi:hypothetical protein ACFU9Y_00980 [Streptomyces sp. NPDC057621]|uniref:hypothetical protein n=1 Tax=Streptomyces sp. NPDC057621 TaxID=3346186 RepID=UPI0036A643ED